MFGSAGADARRRRIFPFAAEKASGLSIDSHEWSFSDLHPKEAANPELGDIMTDPTDWKHDGVRVIPAGSLDTNTAQTPGMNRAAAINFARVGAQKLWAGTVTIHAHAKTGAHHHGHLESVIYVVKGRARMRWGEQLQFVAEAGPGDFIYVPPYVPHQEINASDTEPLECVLVRSDNEAVAINIDITPAEKVEEVYWVDPTHPHPHKH
jgi:uncharacterized RmlC-like cupin family protein